ncbi:putative nucleotidyltransferase substrate binding domain-containing protein [Granulosicoccus sp. 3-233]|uniref:putative nucleotidyltransferase substrate binding domain-containing protein n=1 Tax=Granulosicoccus sp. 3-233 TaxID=3417969 RepID=UPI003D32C9DC
MPDNPEESPTAPSQSPVGQLPAAATAARSMSPSVYAEAGSERLSSVKVSELMSVDPHTIEQTDSIRLGAQRMLEHRISCLPVVRDDVLVGLVTEADFVGRVVATAVSVDQAVSSVMTSQPLHVSPEHSVLDVLTLMTRHRIAHMPVCIEGQLVGIVTQTDLVRHQVASSVFMVGDISRMKSSAAIAEIVQQLPRLLCSLVGNGSSAFETGRIMSSITGAVTRRLLELAKQRFGPAPVAYVWLACGSQGRQEQTGATDQDNCLMLDDSYDPDIHGDYFTRLAEFVCDGLNESGYVYCPGDMMASNPKWRQPLSVWRGYFDEWIERPGPMAQMLASVMFDLRPIHGAACLYEPLRDAVLAKARKNSLFVAHMSSNSLTHRPPLGWFGRFRKESSGEHRGKIDLKHGGVVPIVDLARVYALSAGIPVVNTTERLGAGVDSPVLSQSGALTLKDAHEVILMIRLRHQVRQIKQGQKPDNFVDPALLPASERDRLRRALQSVKEIQAAMNNRVAVLGR